MSDSDSDRDGRTIPAERVETTAELVEENPFAAAAASIIATLRTAAVDPDTTPPRSEDWSLQSRAEHNAAAPIEAQEQVQSRSDSDSPPSQDLPRRRGSSSESEDVLAYTSLALPASGPSSIPLPPIASATAEHGRTLEEQDDVEERNRVAMERTAEQREVERLVRERNERDDELRAHRDSPERQRLLDELDRRIHEFSEDNPVAHTQWARFRERTLVATNSPARRLQILLWYIGGSEGYRVPARLLRQIIRVERWYTRLASLEWRLHRAEVADQSRPDRPSTDNDWAGMPNYEPVGFEREESASGFNNYFPRYHNETEAELLLAHVSANYRTRRIRLLHAASRTEFNILLARMHAFVREALESIEDLEYTVQWTDNPQVLEDFPQRLAEEKESLTTFQDDGIEYGGGLSGFSGLGKDSEESDASEVEEEFPNGMPAAVESEEESEEESDDQSED